MADEGALMRRTKGVDSARRVLQILLQFTDGSPELTVEKLIETHAISVPSAYRYIALLREMNLIEESRRGSFVLSPQLIKLGRAAEASFDYRSRVQPILDRLRDETGECALYLRRLRDNAVCVAIAEIDLPVRLSFQPGSLMPLNGGAAAKMLLAGYPKSKRMAYLDRHNPGLDADARQRLEVELQMIHAAGSAESSGEVDEGVWAAAAAVTLHGKLVGAITVAAPEYRLSAARRREISEAVVRSAKELEQNLAEER